MCDPISIISAVVAIGSAVHGASNARKAEADRKRQIEKEKKRAHQERVEADADRRKERKSSLSAQGRVRSSYNPAATQLFGARSFFAAR